MHLKDEGYEVKIIPVDKNGLVNINALENEIDRNTAIVSIIHVNGETGAIQDIERIGGICLKKGAIFHTDAVQSYGRIKIDVKKMNISLLSAGGHKVGGPNGVGFIFIKEGTPVEPIMYGGKQQKGMRSGTENVPGAAGFAMAASLKYMNKNERTIKEIRDYFINKVEKIGGKWNGSDKNTVYSHAHVTFNGIDGDSLVAYLSSKGIMCSRGSACETNKEEKRILKSLGLNEIESKGSVRFVFSEEINRKDVDYVIRNISKFIRMHS